jgi:hypothetical protein
MSTPSMTAYDILFRHLTDNRNKRTLTAYTINWELAKTIQLKPPFNGWNDVVFPCCFVKERVLQIVDPAIRDTIERLLDLDMITFNSCSGHTKETNNDGGFGVPYLTIIFKSPTKGLKFIKHLEQLFESEKKIFVNISGESIGMIEGIVGPQVPVRASIQHKLPVKISFEFEIDNLLEKLRRIWSLFGQALSHFDHKTQSEIPAEYFKPRLNILPKDFKKIVPPPPKLYIIED